MEILEKNRKSPKRIIFDISDEDHETIKNVAAKKRMTMRMWIIKAMAKAIKEEEIQE